MSKEGKEKWSPCLTQELISSEDSEDEDEGQFIVRPLTWRSDKVTELFMNLDRKYYNRQTTRSKKMSYDRVRQSGQPSDRPKPMNSNLPSWVFKCVPQ